jgi:hypothetical protein
VSAAYDDADNLFITGWGCGSYFNIYVSELAKGSDRVSLITLEKRTDVAPATVRRHSLLYRVQVTGATGKVVGTVLFVVHHQAVVGMAGRLGERVLAWPYPAGGDPVQSVARYEGIDGIALSISNVYRR